MKDQENKFIALLRHELVPALGCTEPIAVAYTAALARELLGVLPERMEVWCSGNIIKNVKSVTVPNSGGMQGIAAAAVLGVLGGDASLSLEVLKPVTQEHRARAGELLQGDYCVCKYLESDSPLDILVRVYAGAHSAAVEVRGHHTKVVLKEKDGASVLEEKPQEQKTAQTQDNWTLGDILDFADRVDPAQLRPIFSQQIALNSAIAQEGLEKPYGAQIGRFLLQSDANSPQTLAMARAAAGSDARMSGCAMPVVINSGSGNQGLTASLPVLTYAQSLGADEARTLRALAVSNLTAIYQKRQIGSLSAYCGAVCAACGSGAAITYLYGGTREQIGQTIVNTIACVGGILCDGAKPSCAAKIATCVNAAILGHQLAIAGQGFHPGEGLVKADADKTIRCYSDIAREGMRDTDRMILEKMLEPA